LRAKVSYQGKPAAQLVRIASVGSRQVSATRSQRRRPSLLRGCTTSLAPALFRPDPGAMQVPIVRLALGDAEVEAAGRVIRSGWVAQGPEVAAFEREFATAVGAPFAVAVSNCTVALELSLRVAGVRPGDDVATVSHSFIATANAVVAVGARPIFVDVQPDTYNMDPAALSRALTPRTRAILCVHQIGLACDLPAILAIARSRDLPVIEDAACAVGSEICIDGNWQRIGRPHSLLACFSFHPRKLITTGDGGMITTADAALAERLRSLRQHAMCVPSTARHDSQRRDAGKFLRAGLQLSHDRHAGRGGPAAVGAPARHHHRAPRAGGSLQPGAGRPPFAGAADRAILDAKQLAELSHNPAARRAHVTGCDHAVPARPRRGQPARHRQRSRRASLRQVPPGPVDRNPAIPQPTPLAAACACPSRNTPATTPSFCPCSTACRPPSRTTSCPACAPCPDLPRAPRKSSKPSREDRLRHECSGRGPDR
jgi:hypothetical protein